MVGFINSIFGLVALVAMVWVIYEVWFVKKSKDTLKNVLWTVAAIFFSIITAIVYYFVEKK